MSYLDDEDHEWELEREEMVQPDLKKSIEHIARYAPDAEAVGIILQGYAGLRSKFPEASDAQCLETSMIWYFG